MKALAEHPGQSPRRTPRVGPGLRVVFPLAAPLALLLPLCASAAPPSAAPAQAPVPLALTRSAQVPDGAVWSNPVWDGGRIVVSYGRGRHIWGRLYDLGLNAIGDAVPVTTDADPPATDHKHILLGATHVLAYSTPGDADLYLLKVDLGLNRLGPVPVVEGTTRERTNDMLLATDGERVVVGRFCPCWPGGVGHRFAVFDPDLKRQGGEVDVLDPVHTNMAAMTHADGAYRVLSFVAGSAPGQPSYLITFSLDPVTLAALSGAHVVRQDPTSFLHASTGLAFDPARRRYYAGYVRGADMWGYGTVVIDAYDANTGARLGSLDVAQDGNRPHLALVDSGTLVVGWDTTPTGVWLGVVKVGR